MLSNRLLLCSCNPHSSLHVQFDPRYQRTCTWISRCEVRSLHLSGHTWNSCIQVQIKPLFLQLLKAARCLTVTIFTWYTGHLNDCKLSLGIVSLYTWFQNSALYWQLYLEQISKMHTLSLFKLCWMQQATWRPLEKFPGNRTGASWQFLRLQIEL